MRMDTVLPQWVAPLISEGKVFDASFWTPFCTEGYRVIVLGMFGDTEEECIKSATSAGYKMIARMNEEMIKAINPAFVSGVFCEEWQADWWINCILDATAQGVVTKIEILTAAN